MDDTKYSDLPGFWRMVEQVRKQKARADEHSPKSQKGSTRKDRKT